MEIPPEKQFHFRDGTSVAGIEELQRKIEGISYQEFYHHVNREKNDFASWVRHVLREEALATELERVQSIVETVEILNDHLHPAHVNDDLQSKIEEQIFSAQVAHETLAMAQEPEMPESAEAEHARHEMPAHEHDRARMIVKDFMYGLVFGLIVGLILGRLISF